eukprot:CAMPEP_0114282860 /NCGR_PEP_ID=MMETSP0059-20121206/3787_1 /TAXON_ID=36894 /ORGANISM="Pyramimonas parkeae, Strain CCMP726" /LENGTH=298 /DNA_ID=CAMNT_0001403537 /DNA_START=359 /DNA_END=1255 /DNA_ORIENTATION=+
MRHKLEPQRKRCSLLTLSASASPKHDSNHLVPPSDAPALLSTALKALRHGEEDWFLSLAKSSQQDPPSKEEDCQFVGARGVMDVGSRRVLPWHRRACVLSAMHLHPHRFTARVHALGGSGEESVFTWVLTLNENQRWKVLHVIRDADQDDEPLEEPAPHAAPERVLCAVLSALQQGNIERVFRFVLARDTELGVACRGRAGKKAHSASRTPTTLARFKELALVGHKRVTRTRLRLRFLAGRLHLWAEVMVTHAWLSSVAFAVPESENTALFQFELHMREDGSWMVANIARTANVPKGF